MLLRYWISVPLFGLVATQFLLMPPTQANAKNGARKKAKIELGRRLFMDPVVSRGGKFSCADCHAPEHGFSDPRTVSVDENGKTKRHSQTLVNLKDGTGFHWDGEFDMISELLTARLAPIPEVMVQTRKLIKEHYESAERRGDKPSAQRYRKRLQSLTPPYYGPDIPVSGTPRPQPILARLNHDGRYEEAFRAAFGSTEPTTSRIVESVKAYVLSIRSGESRYDAFLAGDPRALTASERRGMRLFDGKAGCAECHPSRSPSGGAGAFTDFTYRNTGVAFQHVRLDYDKGFEIDGGFGDQTFASRDIGKFKVPTLRDVEHRAPYMHDGKLASLEDVVRYYEKGGTLNRSQDPAVKPFALSSEQRGDLVAFLKSLSSKHRPGLGKPTRTRARTLRVRLMGPDSRPMRNLAVRITPRGDRLQGGSIDAKPVVASTDRQGYLEFPFPLWTHVQLSALGYEIGTDRLLPDTLKRPLVLLTVPRRKVWVEVFRATGVGLPSRLHGYTRRSGQQASVVTLQRVRFTATNRALYSTDRPRGVQRILATFGTDKNRGTVLRELDTRGGMADPLDLRE